MQDDGDKRVITISQLLLSLMGVGMPIFGYLAANAIGDIKDQIRLISERQRQNEQQIGYNAGQWLALDAKIAGVINTSAERNLRLQNIERVFLEKKVNEDKGNK